jgi:hypothetical protein
MLDMVTAPERRAIGLVFASAFLLFLAWAFPNMSQFITIPGALICLGLAVYFLWPEVESLLVYLRRDPKMTPEDIPFNAALSAGVVSWIAVLLRSRKWALIFAVVATAAVVLDFWTGPPHKLFWLIKPIEWSEPALMIDFDKKAESKYKSMLVIGINGTSKPIKLDSAYLVSGQNKLIQLPLFLDAEGKLIPIAEMDPIPPKKGIALTTDAIAPKGISGAEFLKFWGPIILVSRYDDKEYTVTFSRDVAVKMVTPISAN